MPSLNCPRFLRSSTRSKRFRTFRFAMIVLAPLRLRCCDITINSPTVRNRAPTLRRYARFSTPLLLNDVFGKKLKNALLVRLTDPAFGDQSGNKLTGRNVEPEVSCGARLGSQSHLN